MIVCTFGELLLRLSPLLNQTWIEKKSMPVFIGGAELNVASALANWGLPVRYITKLPDHYLSKEIVSHIRNLLIDTSLIQWGGNRIGTYYLPQGADLKNAGVIYDRTYSAFWELKPGNIDWNIILDGCTWFHWSAISPGLNRQVAKVCDEAIDVARKKGIVVSVDLNYRSKLWQYGVLPHEVMIPLVQKCDVVMGNLWAAESLLNIQSPIIESGGISKQQLIDSSDIGMNILLNTFPSVKQVAYTFRLESEYFALLKDRSSTAVSKTFKLKDVTDKVGSGDCFMGALIYGIIKGLSASDVIDFAASAAVGKMSEQGDATKQTVDMIKNRIKNV